MFRLSSIFRLMTIRMDCVMEEQSWSLRLLATALMIRQYYSDIEKFKQY